MKKALILFAFVLFLSCSAKAQIVLTDIGKASAETLSLDFTTGTLPSEATLTRSSANGTYFNGSGVLTTATTNAARYDYLPTAYTSQYLLYEPSATNNEPYSNLSTSGWTTTNYVTQTLNTVTSPDGTADATTIAEDTTNHYHFTGSNASYAYTSGTTYTFSWYAKADTATVIQYVPKSTYFGGSVYANYDLANGVLGTHSSGTPSITSVGNGWYFCTFSMAATGSGSSGSGALLLVNNNASASRQPTYTGTSRDLYVYGFQRETSATATSLILTNGAIATRSADQLAITIPSGQTQITATFDDNSTQVIGSLSAGSYTLTNTINRPHIKTITSP